MIGLSGPGFLAGIYLPLIDAHLLLGCGRLLSQSLWAWRAQGSWVWEEAGSRLPKGQRQLGEPTHPEVLACPTLHNASHVSRGSEDEGRGVRVCPTSCDPLDSLRAEQSVE